MKFDAFRSAVRFTPWLQTSLPTALVQFWTAVDFARPL
jgi:hypothetical protein